jgi:UDP-galactopyranose mutase
MRYCVVGAGCSGAVIARRLAEAGHSVLIIDERKHLAGNCHTERDSDCGVMAHVYGPHIFHTTNERVWHYIQQFTQMMPYLHQVKAVANGNVYSLPINLLTINQFFQKTMRPPEARQFLAGKAHCIAKPENFEEQALSMIGEELYDAFFRGYTIKQWGIDPTELPASILKRLPVRFDYNDCYFDHPYQGIPRDGYTKMFESILSIKGLELRLGVCFEDLCEVFQHVIYSGPLDRFFKHRLGKLAYRTLDFDVFRTDGDYQGAAVINYCDSDIAFTRVTEHKHFAPWEKSQFKRTVCYREFSRSCNSNDIPYYPVRLVADQALLRKYVELAQTTLGVSFVGRLGTYRYLDMDVTIGEALNAADFMVELIAANKRIPTFFNNPLN